jgi:hypothetical protein
MTTVGIAPQAAAPPAVPQAARPASRRRPPAVERAAVVGVVAATVLAGLLFGPVFGAAFPPQVVVPVAVAGLATFCSYEAARAWPRLERWQAGISIVAGLLALVETTLRSTTANGVPTLATARGLFRGARDSWLLTLQSTWPARPEPGLVLFVPLLVLIAAVLGVQVLTSTRARLAALAPSLAVVGLAQTYHPLSGAAAVLAAVGYAVAATAVLGSVPRSSLRGALRAAALAVPVVVTAASAASAVDLAHRPPYSLKAAAPPVTLPAAVTNPLDEVAYRLEHPDPVLFVNRSTAPVDRWPLAVLDRFDGVNWTSSAQYRQLGSRLSPDPAVRVPTRRHAAEITLAGLPGPWLPSQQRLESATGVRPLVDEVSGTLLYSRVDPGLSYQVSWSSPDLSDQQLAGAAVDSTAAGDTEGLGAVPASVIDLATTAVHGLRPSFQAALLLEQYLRQHYRVAVGENLPTGHGWPQILHFLDPQNTRGGTTEQFAAAYVVLARSLGIPARLVVGFRQPGQPEPDGSFVVRNGDVLAWPEVAVLGAGWVPLDPVGTSRGSGSANDPSGLAAGKSKARQNPAPAEPIRPQVPPPAASQRATRLPDAWPTLLVAVLLACLLGWLAGVPLVKGVRRAVRRRRTGAAAVLAAWLEARDRLRDHGVAVGRDMTARDVAVAAVDVVPSRQTVHAIRRLGALVDTALWSGVPVSRRAANEAWREAGAVRQDLAGRSAVARLVGTVGLRSLRSLR